MTRIELRRQVAQAIRQDWPAFAESHPKLAAVLDRMLLVEEAARALEEDPHYLAVMDQALAQGAAAQAVTDLVSHFVNDWLRRLI